MSAMPPKIDLDTVETPSKSTLTKMHKIVLGVGLALGVIAAATSYLIYSAHHETTDDAYTTGNVHNIASRVAGTVIDVAVNDNEFVRKGQVLARLDARDCQVQVDKAAASYKRAKADYERVLALHGSLNGDIAISKQEFDQMEANLGVAKAMLDDAQNQLDYCTIRAPEDGRIGDKTVQTGNRVAVGTVLMSVVQDVWIVANYKETQVGKMAPGQKVIVSIDAISGHPFTGHIDSFSPGSGSVFALLPPENATGNFTKIVQRVPVKILLDEESARGYEERLVPGLSVETAVDLQSHSTTKTPTIAQR